MCSPHRVGLDRIGMTMSKVWYDDDDGVISMQETGERDGFT